MTADEITRDRILDLLISMDTEDIADRMGLTVAAVHAVIAGVGLSRRWVLICLKTNRTWQLWSERACYRKAQLLGLVDYTFGREPT